MTDDIDTPTEPTLEGDSTEGAVEPNLAESLGVTRMSLQESCHTCDDRFGSFVLAHQRQGLALSIGIQQGEAIGIHSETCIYG